MSAAYMQRALSCHAAQTASTDSSPDPLRVAGVEQVQVRESGAMMRISITSNNQQVARQIVNQAEALKGSQGDVSVEQLSANLSQRTAF
jgi:hypothetical protein